MNNDNNNTQFDNLEFFYWIQRSISMIMIPIDDFHSVCFNPLETNIVQDDDDHDSYVNEEEYSYDDPCMFKTNYLDDELSESYNLGYSDNDTSDDDLGW